MQRPSPNCEIFEETFYPNLQRFVWRSHAGAHPDKHQHGGRKPTETSVTEFCYKNVNLFLNELINIKVILFLIHELFRQENSPKQVIFLTYTTVSRGHHANTASRKSLEIQAYYITKPRTLLKRNLYENQFSAALIHRESKISVGSIVLWFEFQ